MFSAMVKNTSRTTCTANFPPRFPPIIFGETYLTPELAQHFKLAGKAVNLLEMASTRAIAKYAGHKPRLHPDDALPRPQRILRTGGLIHDHTTLGIHSEYQVCSPPLSPPFPSLPFPFPFPPNFDRYPPPSKSFCSLIRVPSPAATDCTDRMTLA